MRGLHAPAHRAVGMSVVVHRAGLAGGGPTEDVDPILTELVRHGLSSAARQMKQALVRTAFSPVIYEVLDFAVALYDPDVRLLAQAPSLPMFMGRLSFCVQAAVEAVGGRDALEPGDVLLYNHPYGTGSHPQDAAVIAPTFDADGLLGYAAIKAHWLDIGGKDPYSTDTVDLWQEGVIFPGVRLCRRGEIVDDILRVARANSRVPDAVAGDINAELVGVRTGQRAFSALVARHGRTAYAAAVERMFDHGERLVRARLSEIPDGDYVATGILDSDGHSDEPVPFEIVVRVEGSDVTVDFSGAPAQRRGPINCTVPKTVAVSRVAIGMIAGVDDSPNEGHQRPIKVVTKPGTLFHPIAPAPSFIGGWASFQALETIQQAIASALPTAVPAGSGGDICSLVWWGKHPETGKAWTDGSPHPVGQGAHAGGDGANALMHASESATRVTPTEVWETRNPWLLEQVELVADSGGAGRHRGGLGVSYRFRALTDAWLTAVIERTKEPPWALAGGAPGQPNHATMDTPDGAHRTVSKVTRMAVPNDAVVTLRTGGGGGYGTSAERDPEAVHADLREGYVTEAAARRDYPHAFS
jgi:N-methylhydantoinase B